MTVTRILLSSLLVLSPSCATVWKSADETMAIDSHPSGATATIRCTGGITAQGLTPARLEIPRKANGCSLSIAKENFATRTIPLEQVFNGPYWGNFAGVAGAGLAIGGWAGGADRSVIAGGAALGVLGLGGFVVDRVTGRAFRHDPDVIEIKLEPLQ